MQRVVYIILHQILNFLLVLFQNTWQALRLLTQIVSLHHPSIIIFHYTCRQELLQAREKHKEEQVIALKRSMESGMVSFTQLLLCLFDSYSIHFVNDKVLLSHFCALIHRHRQWKSKLNSGRRWLTSTSLGTLRWELQIKLYLEMGL